MKHSMEKRMRVFVLLLALVLVSAVSAQVNPGNGEVGPFTFTSIFTNQKDPGPPWQYPVNWATMEIGKVNEYFARVFSGTQPTTLTVAAYVTEHPALSTPINMGAYETKFVPGVWTQMGLLGVYPFTGNFDEFQVIESYATASPPYMGATVVSWEVDLPNVPAIAGVDLYWEGLYWKGGQYKDPTPRPPFGFPLPIGLPPTGTPDGTFGVWFTVTITDPAAPLVPRELEPWEWSWGRILEEVAKGTDTGRWLQKHLSKP